MSRTIRWTKRALRRLERIGVHIAADDPEAAGQVVGANAWRVQHLGSVPSRGRPGRIPGTRELVVVGRPYIVAYRVHDNDIEVLTIQHGAQLWPDER